MRKLWPVVFIGLMAIPLMGAATGGSWSREYGWAEFGGALIPDLDGRLGVNGGSDADVKLKLSPGFAVNGGLGERFNDWLAAEVQGGFLYHNVDEIDGLGGAYRSPDADLLQVPVFFNLVFELPLRSRLTPYAGVGAGAMINWLDIDDQYSVDGTETVDVNDSSTEVNFAFQAFAGGRLRMGEQGVIELTYRFMAAGSPNWSLKEVGTGDTIGNLKAEDLIVHSLTLGFLVEF